MIAAAAALQKGAVSASSPSYMASAAHIGNEDEELEAQLAEAVSKEETEQVDLEGDVEEENKAVLAGVADVEEAPTGDVEEKEEAPTGDVDVEEAPTGDVEEEKEVLVGAVDAKVPPSGDVEEEEVLEEDVGTPKKPTRAETTDAETSKTPTREDETTMEGAIDAMTPPRSTVVAMTEAKHDEGLELPEDCSAAAFYRTMKQEEKDQVDFYLDEMWGSAYGDRPWHTWGEPIKNAQLLPHLNVSFKGTEADRIMTLTWDWYKYADHCLSVRGDLTARMQKGLLAAIKAHPGGAAKWFIPQAEGMAENVLEMLEEAKPLGTDYVGKGTGDDKNMYKDLDVVDISGDAEWAMTSLPASLTVVPCLFEETLPEIRRIVRELAVTLKGNLGNWGHDQVIKHYLKKITVGITAADPEHGDVLGAPYPLSSTPISKIDNANVEEGIRANIDHEANRLVIDPNDHAAPGFPLQALIWDTQDRLTKWCVSGLTCGGEITELKDERGITWPSTHEIFDGSFLQMGAETVAHVDVPGLWGDGPGEVLVNVNVTMPVMWLLMPGDLAHKDPGTQPVCIFVQPGDVLVLSGKYRYEYEHMVLRCVPAQMIEDSPPENIRYSLNLRYGTCSQEGLEIFHANFGESLQLPSPATMEATQQQLVVGANDVKEATRRHLAMGGPPPAANAGASPSRRRASVSPTPPPLTSPGAKAFDAKMLDKSVRHSPLSSYTLWFHFHDMSSASLIAYFFSNACAGDCKYVNMDHRGSDVPGTLQAGRFQLSANLQPAPCASPMGYQRADDAGWLQIRVPSERELRTHHGLPGRDRHCRCVCDEEQHAPHRCVAGQRAGRCQAEDPFRVPVKVVRVVALYEVYRGAVGERRHSNGAVVR